MSMIREKVIENVILLEKLTLYVAVEKLTMYVAMEKSTLYVAKLTRHGFTIQFILKN